MTREEALKLCEVYGVVPDQNTIVTANGNVYTDGNVDPKDTSERVNLNEPAPEPTKTPKKQKDGV